MRAPSLSEKDDDDRLPYTEVKIPMSTFIAESRVRDFLASRGVGTDASQAELERYVPRKIVLQIWPSRVQGELGSDAMGGYVAFNIAYYNGTHGNDQVVSSFLIVTDLYGDEVRISPTMRERRADATHLHFCGLKLRDPDTLLLAGDNGTTEMGPAYLWKWKEDEYVELMEGRTVNCHDIQWAHADAGAGDAGAVWMPATGAIDKYNASTGATLKHLTLDHAVDINHVQLIDDDKTAILSGRSTNDIIKLDVSSGEVQWYLGGSYGDFDIYAEDGKKYDKGESYWRGQHNAEYLGQVNGSDGKVVDEYGMFDNNYDQNSSSRLLVVQVDESTMVATVVFEHRTGEYTPEFGDCDKLPSGNLLTCFWLQKLDVSAWAASGDADEQFDVRVEEIVPSTKLPAWRASVQGPLCEHGTCDDSWSSWKIYSAERFYPRPLVWGVECSDGTLSFSSTNNFRQNNADRAYYVVTTLDGDTLTKGAFGFRPHWQPTEVSVDFGYDYKYSGYVVVSNKWDDQTWAAFDCG